MELYLTRLELRRRLLARMGKSTSSAQSAQYLEPVNEWLRAACYAVYERCPWAKTQTETRVDISIDQRFVNYPTACGPGNLLALAVWDEDESRYVQLRRAVIPITVDDEPLVDAGGDPSEAKRARPTSYEPKAQIELFPRADVAYELKIDHTRHPELETDASVSIVDGEAIILWAMADAYDHEGDERLATVARAKFKDRIDALISAQHPLTTIRRGANDRANALGRSDLGYIPDSGSWPSVVES